jgi:hypothetical protein
MLTETEDAVVGWTPSPATDPRVLELHEIWLRLRGTRRFPRREDFQPERIARFLSGVVLLKVLRDPLNFEYRIVGNEIAQRQGHRRGQRVSRGRRTSTAFRNYCAVYEAGRPQFLDGRALFAYADVPAAVSRIHCPLASDGRTIDFIISFIAFRNQAHRAFAA